MVRKCEGSDIRESFKALDDVEFIPAWGRNRIGSMLETRPDWCISRQRVWGVPFSILNEAANGKRYSIKKYTCKSSCR